MSIRRRGAITFVLGCSVGSLAGSRTGSRSAGTDQLNVEKVDAFELAKAPMNGPMAVSRWFGGGEEGTFIPTTISPTRSS